jgi:hypothetical protein
MEMQELKVKINFIQPILGSMPADEELYTKYIAEKAPADWMKDEEAEEYTEKDYDKNVTVFPQDDKGIYLYNYHVKGFLKNAGNVLKEQLKIKNLRNKLDDYLFIKERKIYLMRNGRVIEEEDEVLERPLRAMTMKGERVTLTASEMIDLPAEATFTIQLIQHKEITMDTIRELLNYGRFQGIGQWRNGSYGQFEWQEIK